MNNKKFDPNNLIKASLGITSDDDKLNSDENIDSYIAKLLTEEANKKRKNYEKLGPSGYLHEKIISTKTQQVDKKFLSNIINRTNRHNTRLDKEDERRLDKTSNQSEPSSSKPRNRSSIRSNLILNHLQDKSKTKLKKTKK